MRIAIVGCGRMGKIHASSLLTIPGTTVVAAVDVHLPSAEAVVALVAERGHVATVHEELTDDTVAKIDAVLIATQYAVSPVEHLARRRAPSYTHSEADLAFSGLRNMRRQL